MKIATWNVNSLKARHEKLLAWLETRSPEILCVQETKITDSVFDELKYDYSGLGYDSYHYGEGRYNGVAILARQEISEVIKGFEATDLTSAKTLSEPRLIRANIGDSEIINVYVPNGREVNSLYYFEKLKFLEHLSELAKNLLKRRKNIIICGDFNVAPDDVDVYDPKALEGSTHVSEPERRALEKLIKLGFFDAFRLLHKPNEQAFTWWDYRAGSFHKNLGMRIDLILISDSLRDKAKDCYIDRDARKNPSPSDHAPVILELDCP